TDFWPIFARTMRRTVHVERAPTSGENEVKSEMLTSISTAFWRRLDVPGHDAAGVSQTAHGYTLFGQSVFLDSRGPAALRYILALNSDWSTIEGQITGFIG